MDDEQRPWWTRPPEPGPETRAPKDTPEPPADQSAPTDLFAPANPYASDPYAPPAPATAGAAGSGGPAVSSPEGVSADTAPVFQPFTFPSAPAPTPPSQQVVRRLAVPAPPRSDETETLPVVDDSIFATFTGELDQIGPGTPTSRGARASYAADPETGTTGLANPQAAPDDERPPRRSPLARLPDGRVLLLAGAGCLVVLLIVVVALISGRGDDAPSTAAPTKRAASTSASTEDPGKRPDGLKELNGDAAAQLLATAGVSPGGTIVDAWDWMDKNGHNMVVEVMSPGAGNLETLRVVHVARLDSKPETLRIMRDPNLPTNCSKGDADVTADFTKDALRVRDLNGDNIAEVMVGWYSSCGGPGAKSEVKLALISNGKKYIIRGQGVIGHPGSGTSKPDPQISKWPESYRTTVQQLYSKLYF